MAGFEFTLEGSPSIGNIIKVLGVGGGGSNAVSYMHSQGIEGVEFIVCNTDVQALELSPVQNKLQIGAKLTAGLGAGANPEVGRKAAEESREHIRSFLDDGTKMLFITAGMGGGTGTGAAPVIAKIARELGILTVGIVTKPFGFEGPGKQRQAEEGINRMREHCDTLITILNDKLFHMFGDLKLSEGFSKADVILTNAAQSISEIVVERMGVNIDFEDVRTVIRNAGSAVMGTAIASGEDRASIVADKVLESPLLNNFEIAGSTKILISLKSSSKYEMTMSEMAKITSYIQERSGAPDMIWGTATDESLGENIKITLIATGFDSRDNYVTNNKSASAPHLGSQKNDSEQKQQKAQAGDLTDEVFEKLKQQYADEEEEDSVSTKVDYDPKPVSLLPLDEEVQERHQKDTKEQEEQDQFQIRFGQRVQKPSRSYPEIQLEISSVDEEDEEEASKEEHTDQDHAFPLPLTQKQRIQQLQAKKRRWQEEANERRNRFRGANAKPGEAVFRQNQIPAFKRNNVSLEDEAADGPHIELSNFSLSPESNLLGNNSFLHDNPD